MAVIITVICGCSRPKPKIDCSFPDKENMANILADIYTIDAILLNSGSRPAEKQKFTEACYHTVLSKYGIKKSDFDSIMAWYSADPDLYSDVCEKVISILGQHEAVLKNIAIKKDSLIKLKQTIEDSISVKYTGIPRFVRLPIEKNDTIPADLAFEWPLDSVTNGIINFSANYIFYRNDEMGDTAIAMLNIAYSDSVVDTVKVVVNSKRKNSTIETDTIYDLRQGAKVKNISCVLLENAKKIEKGVTITNASLKYLPYNVNDSIKPDEIFLPLLFTK